MTHLELKQLYERTKNLIQHLSNNGNAIFKVNYALNRNLKLMESKLTEIDKSLNKELLELEGQALSLGHGDHAAGLLLLSEEQQLKRSELYAQYLIDMQNENDYEVYTIDPKDCENLKIEFAFIQTLTEYFPK